MNNINENFLKSLDLETRLKLGGSATTEEVEGLMGYVEELEDGQVMEDFAADKLDALRGAVLKTLEMLETGADRDTMFEHLKKALNGAW